MTAHGGQPRAGTLLAELLRRRRQTPEEFSEQAERYAREHGLNATLSARHVQRLASGRRADGRPLGPVRPATRRLLEDMLSVPVERLLASLPDQPAPTPDATDLELSGRLAVGRGVDSVAVDLFRKKLDITRVIDRKFGASALRAELGAQIALLTRTLRDVLVDSTRADLASVLVDASALAGWQALDQGDVNEAWEYYNVARTAALEARSRELEAYACAGQAVVLLDIGESQSAVELTGYARSLAGDKVAGLLRAWLSAAHGEACAANKQQGDAMRAFDIALTAIPASINQADTPYLVFDETHLSRWRGSALARLGSPEAVDVLTGVLSRLEPTFTRAEAALRVDLAAAYSVTGDHDEARLHADRARLLAAQIGSKRQGRRLTTING